MAIRYSRTYEAMSMHANYQAVLYTTTLLSMRVVISRWSHAIFGSRLSTAYAHARVVVRTCACCDFRFLVLPDFGLISLVISY